MSELIRPLFGNLTEFDPAKTDPDRIYTGELMDPGGMVFWKRERLSRIAQLERRQAVLDLGEP